MGEVTTFVVGLVLGVVVGVLGMAIGLSNYLNAKIPYLDLVSLTDVIEIAIANI